MVAACPRGARRPFPMVRFTVLDSLGSVMGVDVQAVSPMARLRVFFVRQVLYVECDYLARFRVARKVKIVARNNVTGFHPSKYAESLTLHCKPRKKSAAKAIRGVKNICSVESVNSYGGLQFCGCM